MVWVYLNDEIWVVEFGKEVYICDRVFVCMDWDWSIFGYFVGFGFVWEIGKNLWLVFMFV